MPSQITDQDDPAQYVVNRYSITGQKVSSLDQDGNGRIYVGSLVYDVQGAQITLESAPFRGGRFVAAQGASGASYALQYHVTDHLGSVRVVLDRDGNVLEQSDFYPFGKRWETAGSPVSGNRYRYNGKEVAASRLLDYGARYYSPGLGRWLSVEPLADFFPSQSLYAMCFDNPVRFVDPFGLAPGDKLAPGDSVYYDEDMGYINGIYVYPDSGDSSSGWGWGGYDEWLEGIDDSFHGAVGGGGYGGGGVGGGGGGGGSSPGSVYGGQVMQKYNDYVKDVNGVVDPAVEIINRATDKKINGLAKAGKITFIAGAITATADAKLALNAYANGQPWGSHAYEAAKGFVGLCGLVGTGIVYVAELVETGIENYQTKQSMPAISFTPAGIEQELNAQAWNIYYGAFGY